MRIIESYLNDYKQSTKHEQSVMSDKMVKYIIGSCFKKMNRRAFHWASSDMIGFLTRVDRLPTMPSVIKPDHKLSAFLRCTTEETNKETFGQWVMTYHPSKSPAELPSLDDLLAFTAGHSDYKFDDNIETIFHSLLLSSLYAYICLTMKLKRCMNANDVGQFCNAIHLLYLLSHSNAMKAYFTDVPIAHPSFTSARHHKETVLTAVHKKLGWEWQDVGDNEDGDEDSDPQERFLEDSAGSVYRRSFMSFVDHYAALRLLERRAGHLPADEKIKLSLVAVKHPRVCYSSWKEMEGVIHKTCQDFRSTTTPNPVEGQVIITKIKGLVKESLDRAPAIFAFQRLLDIHEGIEGGDVPIYPRFQASIHCESSLAAILCQLHDVEEGSNSDLHKLFQACPSSHSSSFTP
jgi:hypothetical protein